MARGFKTGGKVLGSKHKTTLALENAGVPVKRKVGLQPGHKKVGGIKKGEKHKATIFSEQRQELIDAFIKEIGDERLTATEYMERLNHLIERSPLGSLAAFAVDHPQQYRSIWAKQVEAKLATKTQQQISISWSVTLTKPDGSEKVLNLEDNQQSVPQIENSDFIDFSDENEFEDMNDQTYREADDCV